MSWTTVDEFEKHTGSKGWLSLKNDGDGAKVLVLSEPEIITKRGDRYGSRDVIRIFVAAGKTPDDIKRFDFGVKSMKFYREAVRPGDEGKRVIEITRKGAAGDTDTRYHFRHVYDVPPENQGPYMGLVEVALGMLLKDRGQQAAPSTPDAPEPAPEPKAPPTGEEIPF